jgi:subtilisin family serine protease
MRKRLAQWLLVVCLTCLLVAQSLSTARPTQFDQGLETAIRESLQQAGREISVVEADGRLAVAAARIVQVDNLNYRAYAVKILDQATDTIHSYWYDEEVQPISEEDAFQARATAYEARYGHVSRSLFSRLDAATPAELIRVAIWAEQGPGRDTPLPAYPFKVYLPYVQKSEGMPCESAVECAIWFLETRGYAADYVSSEVPVVYAELPAPVIGELQAQPYVAAIYEQADNLNTLYSAGRTAAAPWTWSRGITGSGIKVAVLEVPDRCGTGSSGVVTSNPYVWASAYYDHSQQAGEHATMVAGVIGSTHATDRGIAHGATLLSANATKGTEGKVIAAADWAIKEGADVINASFGSSCEDRSIGSQDKYFDWVVWEKQKTVVVSAGNLANKPDKPPECPSTVDWPYCPSNYNVSSPGKAYNVITVGAKDDKNTAETEADTKDDQFCYFSLYVDPETASSNRLKPEVVAVGQRINTTIPQSPWIGEEVAGTSFSAPIVAGQAALMMQRKSWLKWSPEAVKAGIMTTARWTSLKDDQDPGQQASIDKMGLGAVDTTAADNSLINDRIQGLYLHETDFTDDHYDIFFDVTVPERIRVIIVWSSHPNRMWITNWILHDRLESDFDLTVRTPSGQIFGSYAADANYEIVEFMAPETGPYRARIHLQRWDHSSMEERVGFAWYSGGALP